MRVRVNERSLSAKLDRLESVMSDKVKPKLKNIARELSTYAPVDTGAYAESFAVGNRTRSRTSRGRPRNQDVGSYQGVAYSNMASDIDALDLSENLRIPFTNKAPHAKEIEGAYQVFGKVRDRNR